MLKGRLGQNGVAILAALAIIYPYRHPFAVDIGQLQGGLFRSLSIPKNTSSSGSPCA